MKERLQKILSSRGICSRRKAEEMITAGRVTVNGAAACLGDAADPELDEALARLPAKYRTVIHLHYFENYDTSKIAVLTGRRASTVRAQLTRARQMLGSLLKECDTNV